MCLQVEVPSLFQSDGTGLCPVMLQGAGGEGRGGTPSPQQVCYLYSIEES